VTQAAAHCICRLHNSGNENRESCKR